MAIWFIRHDLPGTEARRTDQRRGVGCEQVRLEPGWRRAFSQVSEGYGKERMVRSMGCGVASGARATRLRFRFRRAFPQVDGGLGKEGDGAVDGLRRGLRRAGDVVAV